MWNQDDNKRFTTDYATLQYSNQKNIQSIMFIDRDELLFCPEGSYNVEQQRDYQQSLITNLFNQQNNYHQVIFPRYNYASVVDLSPLLNTTSSTPPLTDRYIQTTLEGCVLNSYHRRSIFAYFHCFSDVTVYKTKNKAIYSINACPFHELHFGCLRCKCKKLNYNLKHEITK